MLRTLICTVMILMLLPAAGSAQEAGKSLEQQNSKEMAFGQLSEKQQKLVVGMLKKLFKEGKVKAEDSIRDNGSFVPYAYVANHQGKGQFLHIDPEQEMRAEVAAHAVQKTIVTNALRGDLAASGLFMTSKMPQGIKEKTKQELAESIKGDRSIEDVRFLMVELQHLGGLGLLMSVPYWENDEDKWVFGKPISQQINAELQATVQNMMRKAAQKQKNSG
ncbi:hypothetical protein [Salicola sp. Rm-C-2C1-2]|uniref:hypothetical protein n=1 Tax=Salicola sp. Rm-C-2C1-2 TaxID=3141321 RepID=UPI0032E511FC